MSSVTFFATTNQVIISWKGFPKYGSHKMDQGPKAMDAQLS